MNYCAFFPLIPIRKLKMFWEFHSAFSVPFEAVTLLPGAFGSSLLSSIKESTVTAGTIRNHNQDLVVET